jgi:hypothetical protein
MEKPIYDTSQANDFPISIEGAGQSPSFLGYQLVNGYPKFRYSLGKHNITELLTMNDEKKGLIRSFTISPPAKTVFQLTPSATASVKSNRGKITTDGTLKLSSSESAQFSLVITPIAEAN